MDFEVGEHEFREEVRQFIQENLTSEAVAEVESGMGFGPHCWEFIRAVGRRGWWGMGWPPEYGGTEGSYLKRYILCDELAYHRAPFPGTAVGIVAPILLRHGSEELKREFLPRIAQGEIEFALGYTEPEAGTDLASLQLRAERDGDYYILNGQKVFNTACHYAHYHWLAARTNPHVPKHQGISLFIVPLDSPGITITPIYTLMGVRTNQVFYDNVKVPRRYLVGEENQGWRYIMSALDFERVALIPPSRYQRMFEEVVAAVKEAGLSQEYSVRQRLAEIAIGLEIARLLAYRVIWMVNRGLPVHSEASIYKVYISEFRQHFANLSLHILGLRSFLRRGSKWAVVRGEVERAFRTSIFGTFAGGSTEILRTEIAIRGLGLPRGRSKSLA